MIEIAESWRHKHQSDLPLFDELFFGRVLNFNKFRVFYSSRSFGRIWPPLQMVTLPFTTFRLPFSSSCWKLYFSAVASLSPPSLSSIRALSQSGQPPTHTRLLSPMAFVQQGQIRKAEGWEVPAARIAQFTEWCGKNLLLNHLVLNEFIWSPPFPHRFNVSIEITWWEMHNTCLPYLPKRLALLHQKQLIISSSSGFLKDASKSCPEDDCDPPCWATSCQEQRTKSCAPPPRRKHRPCSSRRWGTWDRAATPPRPPLWVVCTPPDHPCR